MSDRELLELAAKAAGVDFYTPEGMDTPWCGRGFYLRGYVVWNPLSDDGDALRLAVKLRLDIEHLKSSVNVWKDCIGTGFIQNGNDLYAATRCAIVRAAAEIGRNMK